MKRCYYTGSLDLLRKNGFTHDGLRYVKEVENFIVQIYIEDGEMRIFRFTKGFCGWEKVNSDQVKGKTICKELKKFIHVKGD